jgi:hypothetical protein
VVPEKSNTRDYTSCRSLRSCCNSSPDWRQLKRFGLEEFLEVKIAATQNEIGSAGWGEKALSN